MLSSVLVKREGMETLKEIIKKDPKYVEGIKESSVVRNGVRLLGGRKRRNGREKDRKEGEKGSEEGEEEEKGGIMEEMECVEMRVREKILLIELLNELVKGGMEIVEEEEMKEVLMELEEEGNKHVEEEIEGEGEGEEKKEEKREWEELSEKACMLLRMIEKKKNRREGKKSESWKMMKKKEEEMEKRAVEAERRREEEKQQLEEEKKKREEEKKELEERISRMEREMEEMKKDATPPTTIDEFLEKHKKRERERAPEQAACLTISKVTQLDKLPVLLPPPPPNSAESIKEGQKEIMKITGNLIVHSGQTSYRNCFIGGQLKPVCFFQFIPFVASFTYLLLFSSLCIIRVFTTCLFYSPSSLSPLNSSFI